MESFKGKRVLITGGSIGIGLAMVTRLVKGGAHVVNLSRSKGDWTSLSKEQGSVETLPCDIGDSKAVLDALEQLKRRQDTIDILINNAGIALGAPKVFWEQPLDDIHRVIATNVLGLVNVTHAALRLFLAPAARGTILNISSITGLEVPIKGMGEVSYHASKAFLEGFTNTLRHETIGTDIRVLTLRPGFVRTNFHFDRVGKDQTKFEGVFEGMEPLSSDDVAEAAIWALSQPERISIKALDIVPTAQRSLTQNDRDWNARHKPE